MVLIDCCLTWSSAGELILSENDHQWIQNHLTQLMLLVVVNANKSCRPVFLRYHYILRIVWKYRFRKLLWTEWAAEVSALQSWTGFLFVCWRSWSHDSPPVLSHSWGEADILRGQQPFPRLLTGLNRTSVTSVSWPLCLGDEKQISQLSSPPPPPLAFYQFVCSSISRGGKACAPTLPAQLSKLSINRGLRPKLPAVLMDTFATSSLQFVWQLWKKQRALAHKHRMKDSLGPADTGRQEIPVLLHGFWSWKTYIH